jgi:glycosyltransferase involved in cell wall biosynthesis
MTQILMSELSRVARTDPHVTVLMAVYNGEKHLREAIDSVLGQTFDDFEFLIVDDASTDGTAEILRSLADSRMRVIHNKENMGLPKSLNRGLKLARGEYVARMDADDRAFPDRIERQVQYLDEHHKAGLVVSGVNVINESGELTYTYLCNLSSEGLYYELLFCNCIFHSSAMFRKSTVLQLGGYDESFTRASDYELWSRMRTVSRIDCISAPLMAWRDSAANMSTVFKREQDDAAYRIFINNIETLLGMFNDIETIVCFHDEGFSERHAIVTYDALRKLEKIQQQLKDGCPAWLDNDELNTYCEQKMRFYLELILANRQFKDVLHLLRHTRFRKLAFELATHRMRTLTKRNNG